MKFAVILPDGAADAPVPALDGRTPLAAARTPAMDWISRHGRLGRVVTVPDGFVPGTDVATLSLLGYDPRRCYSGRAPIEAAARGLRPRDGQVVFRCNFVTIRDGRMKDFTAGHVAQAEADRLIADLNAVLGADGCQFFSGVSYRNLLLADGIPPGDLRCAPPHDIAEQPVALHLPRGAGAQRVQQVMERGARLLSAHPVNARRRAEGREPVTDIWLWGQGRPTPLENFRARFGRSCAVITAVDVLRGIAVGAGMDVLRVPGATGYLDTDYAAKGAAAVRALDTHDLVAVHIEAPDEAGHLGDVAEKVRAIERIDEAIVAPLLDALRGQAGWGLMVAPDHPTPVGTRAHSAAPPPFCCAGSGIAQASGLPFTEADAERTGDLAQPGWSLLPSLLGAA